MNKQSRSIVLFTLEYPYGTKENFLENEIPVLSRHCEHIYIIPSNLGDAIAREIPNNVTIINDLTHSDNIYQPTKLMNYFFVLINVYFYQLIFSQRRINYIKYYKSLFHHFYNDITKLRLIEKVIENNKLYDCIFYDYWMLNSTLSLCYLKKKKIINHLIVRTHGYDLYEERHIEKVIPFFEFKCKYIDDIYTISNHGKKYLLNRISKKYSYKVKNSYLGVFKPKRITSKSDEKIIVSCSSLLKFKQVDKIIEALRNVDTPCRWIHFGDGAEKRELQELITTLPTHVKSDLRGFIDNKALMQFYSTHYISCFISLSLSEGLPVSMMEAQSYGIPIIAPPINGIPEIVNKNTGILLLENYTVNDVSISIDTILKEDIIFDRAKIIEHFDSKFNAENNYTKFAIQLLNLRNDDN